MSKSCVICGGEENEGELLVDAPCGRHSVCSDDVASFFERATLNESLFPPKCCGQMFLLADYEDYVPFGIQWAYQMKEQGEYAILAKYRVYCANQPCAKFLHPTSHVADPDTKITYAICENEDCGKLTCCSCKTLLEYGTQNHVCHQDEDEKKFKEAATKKGYQECFVCGATVELAEACNHITCECGHQFCYICGKDWSGPHGCPRYGPAVYDAEGYNQEGFHRDTSLNRDGLTYRQAIARARGQENEDPGDEEDEEDEDPDWEVLQHIDVAERAIINQLPQDAREDALDNLRIMLHDTQGIVFGQGQGQNNEDDGGAGEDEDENENENENDGVNDEEQPHQANEVRDDNDNAVDEETHQNDQPTDEQLSRVRNVLDALNAFIEGVRRAPLDLLTEEDTPQDDQNADEQPNEELSPDVPPALFDPLYNDEETHAGTPEGGVSLSSATEDVHPPTPMDIDESPLAEEIKEPRRPDGYHAPPHGWYGIDEQL